MTHFANHAARLDAASLTLRLGLGLMFIAHGLLKVLVFTLPGTVGYFESLGLPAIFAYLTVLAEVGGGALILLGLYSGLVSLALIPVLAGALFMAHWQAGWLFSNPGGGWEYPAFLIVASIALVFLGDGRYSVRSALKLKPILQVA